MTARATPEEDADGAEGAGPLFVPAGARDGARPDPRLLPVAPVTRFAPAPTGRLHLGHLVNALYTWGLARAAGGRVVLRIEDHDRQRSRPELEAALLDDLERLGLVPDEPSIAAFRAGPTPYRQSDAGDVVRGGARGPPRAGPRLRLRLRPVHVRGLRGGARAAVARDRVSRRVPRPGHSPRTGTRACGWPWARARSAGWTCWRGRSPTSRRGTATCSSATGSATGRTRSAWSWTTPATAWTS